MSKFLCFGEFVRRSRKSHTRRVSQVLTVKGGDWSPVKRFQNTIKTNRLASFTQRTSCLFRLRAIGEINVRRQQDRPFGSSYAPVSFCRPRPYPPLSCKDSAKFPVWCSFSCWWVGGGGQLEEPSRQLAAGEGSRRVALWWSPWR